MIKQNLSVTKLNIWDLDGTVINSFGRVQPCLLPNGDLDLDKYRKEACTHEAIQSDTLLPLVELMRQSMADPTTVNAIVTARMLSKSDYYYLRRQQLRGRDGSNVQVFSRDTLAKHFDHSEVDSIYYSGDANYKRRYLQLLREAYPNATMTMYDDHDGVLAMAASMGIRAVDAKVINDVMALGIQIAGAGFIDDDMNDDLDIEYLQAKLDFAWNSLTAEEQSEYTAKVHTKAA